MTTHYAQEASSPSQTGLLHARSVHQPLMPQAHGDKTLGASPHASDHAYLPAQCKHLPDGLAASQVGRYAYQHQTLSPDDGTPCVACDTGRLYNKIVLPVGLRVPNNESMVFESYSAFFFRFKPRPSDGTLGVATVRLQKSLKVSLKKIVYAVKPGGGEFDYKDDTVPVPTGLKTRWVCALHCNIYALPQRMPEAASPKLLPPQLPKIRATSSPVWGELKDAVHANGTDEHTPFETTVPSHQINQRDELNFLYEAHKEYLIELRLSTTVYASKGVHPSGVHGLMVEASTLVEAVYLDTRGYL